MSRFAVLAINFVLLIMALLACASEPKELVTAVSPSPTSTTLPTPTALAIPTDTPTSTATANAEPVDDDDGRFPNLNGREITIAVENNYLPFNYILQENGQPGGWDYAIWHEICAALNCKPVFVTAVPSQIMPALASGQYDAAANGMILTLERLETSDFSHVLFYSEQRLLAQANEHRFTSMTEFIADETLVVGVRADSVHFETASKLLPVARIKTYEQFPSLLSAISNGDVDAIIINAIILDQLIQDYMGVNAQRLKFASATMARHPIGFAFPPDSDLVHPVNTALQTLRQNGIFDQLAQQYFSDAFSITHNDVE
ncbi:MAG: amino acid ABC transporter substrate-binding protein [Chloroflexi bacterium]|nr:amino acid ABC transporter substrate-binding protein [Chloroflexota bacterium]